MKQDRLLGVVFTGVTGFALCGVAAFTGIRTSLSPTARAVKTSVARKADSRTRAVDPGNVPLRRLSNAEYNNTVRDITGVDLQPAREFPADGAAGEGFTNASESLSAISPTLFTKYFKAARDIAEHAVLLPDGFRFSAGGTRRDWTDESTAQLRAFYATYTDLNGKLPLAPYLTATIKHRAALASGSLTLEQVAKRERIHSRYLRSLWEALTGTTASYPLETIREQWRKATESDVPTLVSTIESWQSALWRTVRVGSYVQNIGLKYSDSPSRQVPNDPTVAEVQSLRLTVKPTPGQSETVISLATREMSPLGTGGVVWLNPRFEAPGKSALFLRNYAQFGSAYEIEYPAVFANSARYLAAAREASREREGDPDGIAKKQGLDAEFLRRWIATLDITRLSNERNPDYAGRSVPSVALKPLDEKMAQDVNRPAIRGWQRKGAGLPALITNSSDVLERIPGRAAPHGVMVHPTPQEFVAVVWTSPISGTVSVTAKVTHAHPDCGNGIAWWIEQRHNGRAGMLTEGLLPLGGEVATQPWIRRIAKGDQLILAVDAKDGNHGCDLTELGFTITETGGAGQAWSLADDVANTVNEGNPHADHFGNKAVWSFVEGPTRPVNSADKSTIPPSSLLALWREEVLNSGTQETLTALEARVQRLLSGTRPMEDSPNRALYDNLVSPESPLFLDVDVAHLVQPRARTTPFALPVERFGTQPNGKPIESVSLQAEANSTLEIHLPTALLLGREFVVEARQDAPSRDRATLFSVVAGANVNARWDGRSPVVAAPNSDALKRVVEGDDAFRRYFPLFFCFPNVVPNDEVVSLKMFHREDEPLSHLMLERKEVARLEKLWAEHRFISRQAVAENEHLPLFIGFVTQDQTKEMLAYFEGQRPAFKQRAEALERDEKAAIPKQMEALLAFAAKAYRRPLLAKERTDLLGLYQNIRSRGQAHEQAFRNVLARILVSPPFLFRIEQSPAGNTPSAVNDLELATRLSYFLWASAPDNELRRVAETGQLHNSTVLAAQVRRMLQDERVRALAIEFGAQWLHVRGFDTLNEKNERLFPTFDVNLRTAIYEETVRFFQDIFQADRAVTTLLSADYTFLNETLATHYGIPGVTGAEWRRVVGVQKYHRGGLLGLASIQTKESGASRTSPILRGNWVVETLLGERLPRPPANVPRLPEEEANAGLTVRQQVERHTKTPDCAICHRRIDPYGFAMEQYDPIGRFRTNDLGGRLVEVKTKTMEGASFTGMEGLRAYLLKEKGGVITRLFCQRLLGYALGRAISPQDAPLIDKMGSELSKNGGRFSTAVRVIVDSPQFRTVRGRDYAAH